MLGLFWLLLSLARLELFHAWLHRYVPWCLDPVPTYLSNAGCWQV